MAPNREAKANLVNLTKKCVAAVPPLLLSAKAVLEKKTEQKDQALKDAFKGLSETVNSLIAMAQALNFQAPQVVQTKDFETSKKLIGDSMFHLDAAAASLGSGNATSSPTLMSSPKSTPALLNELASLSKSATEYASKMLVAARSHPENLGALSMETAKLVSSLMATTAAAVIRSAGVWVLNVSE